MRPSFLSFSLIFFLYFSYVTTIFAETPHEYVQKIHNEIIEVVKEKQNIFEEKPEEFLKSIEQSLEPLVDFKRISRNVMGIKYYKLASIAQRERFLKVFRSTLLSTYSKTLAEFKDEEIKILPKVEVTKRPDREKIYLEIVTKTKVYPAIYYMYLNDKGEWKLINIVINGVNLGLTFRNQFSSLMKKNENNIDKVIDTWISSL